jgi:CBS domain-containing protein
MSFWASMPLEGNADRVLSSLEQGLNVGLIATFDFACCDADERVADVLARQNLAAFDYVPVRRGGDIVGLLNRTSTMERDSLRVHEVMDSLQGNMLISSGAGILSFIESADSIECRLVLRGSRVDGIVTLSDLQKLPVRPAIFLLITHLELLMLAWLRKRSEQTSEIEVLDKLSAGRKEKLEGEWERLQTNNLAIDKLSATQFCDKRELLIKLGFPVLSKGAARTELEEIEGLRDSVAHAGDYALTRDNALSTVATVRSTRRWLDDLERELDRSQVTGP